MVAPLSVSVTEEDPLEVVKSYCQVVKHSYVSSTDCHGFNNNYSHNATLN